MFDVSKMTDEELRTAQKEIFAEVQKREKVAQEKMWRDFVEALRAYNKRFGDIEIHDDCTVYLNHTDFDLETFGEISPKY